jgi:hypothetical protein
MHLSALPPEFPSSADVQPVKMQTNYFINNHLEKWGKYQIRFRWTKEDPP